MDGYDHTRMPFMGNPLQYSNGVTAEEYMNAMPALGLQAQHYQTPTYNANAFGGPSNQAGLGHSLSLPVEANREFTSAYDDFHFDSIPQPDPQESPHPPQDSLTSSLDRDNELLGFRPPTYNFHLLDNSLRRTTISLHARLHGMFFMADDVPITPGLYPQMQTPLQGPPELTCYRRNLFQVTGSITLPRSLRYIFTENGDRIPIGSLELAVSATESVEGHAVKLISVPWKTPVNNPSPMPEDKTEREPTTIPLDTMSNQDMDADYATFPIAWKRLQFRIATANNGRRKELQQHFTAHLKLMATLATGEKVAIAEARSAAIVVRGRSPRNFQQRKDSARPRNANSHIQNPHITKLQINVICLPTIKIPPAADTAAAFPH
ncbi:hypothetical protein P7C71_g2109, partial [Lecanoromycetidae sp. Uapishka_2]